MREIFVFGSNLAGRHGKGAAKFAVENHGAIYGQGIGLQGNSYAIPTKDSSINTLPLSEIQKYVESFISFAKENKNLTFKVTAIGCGLAGYKPKDIAPMFKEVLLEKIYNVILPEEFVTHLRQTFLNELIETSERLGFYERRTDED